MHEAMLVALREVVETDSSLVELADLPLGWSASRIGKNSPWVWSHVAVQS
jgi:hypothetical protein